MDWSDNSDLEYLSGIFVFKLVLPYLKRKCVKCLVFFFFLQIEQHKSWALYSPLVSSMSVTLCHHKQPGCFVGHRAMLVTMKSVCFPPCSFCFESKCPKSKGSSEISFFTIEDLHQLFVFFLWRCWLACWQTFWLLIHTGPDKQQSDGVIGLRTTQRKKHMLLKPCSIVSWNQIL